jgi:hypothetical protein
MHTVAHENSFEGSDKECLTEHMYALDRPGERGEVAADESAQHQMPLVCHQRLVIRMAYVAAHARVVHPPVVPRTLPKPKKHKTKKKLDLVNTVEQLTWQV